MNFSKEDLHGLPIVLYGAGRRAATSIQFLAANGISPVCFCDSDSERWNSRYLELPVMSIEQAREQYGDFYVYITTDFPVAREIFQQLLDENILPPGRILNDMNVKKYTSCSQLESYMLLWGNDLVYCCGSYNLQNKSAAITCSRSIREAVDEFTDFRDHLIAANQVSSQKTLCTGCQHLVEGYWQTDRKVRTLALGTIAPCHVSCIYCAAKKQNVSRSGYLEKNKVSFKRLVEYLVESDTAARRMKLVFGSGELTIHPQVEELLDVAEKFIFETYSTGALFNERLAHLLAKPGNSMDISLDCGTRDTYLTVKRADFFERVVANIRKYRKMGGNITLKYIFMPENSNDVDVDSFMETAIENGVSRVFISRDLNKPVDSFGSSMLRAANRMVKKARQNNMPVTVLSYFTEEQLQIIEG